MEKLKPVFIPGTRAARLPDIGEIYNKVNEIIDYINGKEAEMGQLPDARFRHTASSIPDAEVR